MNLYLVRHAHAGDRGRWDGPDAERPLSAKGRDQADDLTVALDGLPIERVLSSPALRCQQTVAPIARHHGVTVEVSPAFGEGAPCAPARAVLDDLLRDGRDAVVCSHGDLLPELLYALEAEGVVLAGAGFAKGAVWHVLASDGRFERAIYHRHPEPGRLLRD